MASLLDLLQCQRDTDTVQYCNYDTENGDKCLMLRARQCCDQDFPSCGSSHRAIALEPNFSICFSDCFNRLLLRSGVSPHDATLENIEACLGCGVFDISDDIYQHLFSQRFQKELCEAVRRRTARQHRVIRQHDTRQRQHSSTRTFHRLCDLENVPSSHFTQNNHDEIFIQDEDYVSDDGFVVFDDDAGGDTDADANDTDDEFSFHRDQSSVISLYVSDSEDESKTVSLSRSNLVTSTSRTVLTSHAIRSVLPPRLSIRKTRRSIR